MSASRLIFGVVLGGALATGSLYVTQNPEKVPWMAKAMGETPDPQVADSSVKTAIETLQAHTKITEPKDEVELAMAKEEPSLAGREIAANAKETMAAANALKRRMEGEALTGSGVQDKLLGDLEKSEREDFEQAARAQEEAARAPSSTSPSTVIVMDATTGIDPTAEDKIMELAVPESVRQEILKNYRRTGQMPAFMSGK